MTPVADNAFLEYAEVFGNFYGTPKADVMAVLERGGDVLFDIDWQGTQQVANAARDDLVSVFVLPRRERHFRTGWFHVHRTAKRSASRMAKASDEISHYREYDYIVVNDDLELAVGAVRSILAAERLRRDRQSGLTSFVRGLQSEGG